MAPSQSELTLEDLQSLQDTSAPQATRHPATYFAELLAQFQLATKVSPDVTARYFKIGPYQAKFAFTCPELALALFTPFLHLEIDPVETPDLAILFWDSHHSGVPLHPPRWSSLQGQRVALHGGGIFIQYDFSCGALHAFRQEDRTAIYWIKDAREIHYSELACPGRAIFHWLTQDSPLQLIHGGSVGDPNGAVILVGKGGSGKSTSCSAILKSDLYFMGDDYCLVDAGRQPRVFGLYASTKLNPDMLPKFPHLDEFRIPNQRVNDKPSFLIFEPFQGRLRRELPLKAILIPRVTGRRDTRIVPASSMQALQALAPSTLFQSSGLQDASFKKIARLSRALPCYQLESGTELDSIPREIGSLLKSL